MATWSTMQDNDGNSLQPILSPEELQQRRRQLMDAYNVVPTRPLVDLPSQAEKEEDVMFILRAMLDQRFAKHTESPQAFTALYGNRPFDSNSTSVRYGFEYMMLAAWSIMEDIISASKGICTFDPYDQNTVPAYHQYAGYLPRLFTVINIFRTEKNIVQSCFAKEYAAIFAWNPNLQLNRAQSNRRSNANKKRRTTAGRRLDPSNEASDAAPTPDNAPPQLVNNGPTFLRVGLKPSPPKDLETWLQEPEEEDVADHTNPQYPSPVEEEEHPNE
ncbi:hypothetical protein F5Y18DRAFT_432056 [Xylariaceae sp. FL1019]|nr:hypothetical protein F5Y18DRAFT_432056 [Xylariaceae sp. FL1019]